MISPTPREKQQLADKLDRACEGGAWAQAVTLHDIRQVVHFLREEVPSERADNPEGRQDYPGGPIHHFVPDKSPDKKVLFSSWQDPRSWDVNAAAHDGPVITCATNADAKKAERLFNDLLARAEKAEAENQRYFLIASLCQTVANHDVGEKLDNPPISHPVIDAVLQLQAERDSALSARGHITELPAEFAALAEFYQVDDMPALIRIQAEHIERLQKKLPPLRGPESDPQNYRQG